MDDAALAYSLDTDSNQAHAVFVRLVGQVDIQTVGVMGAAIAEAATSGPREIVLDLSEVDFIDSSGLRQIVTSSNELDAVGCHVCVEGLSGAAQRLLEVTGLIERLQR
jgi:anti-sigma B factor antagonist